MSENQGTVLLVEDEANIADLIDLYLKRDGFRLVRATTGREGLELFRRERPRLVIVDVGLPGELDGFDLCKAIRAESSTPVLFLTAQSDEIDRVLGLELGADDYVTKPFSPRELVARLKAILRRSDGGPGTGEARAARERRGAWGSTAGPPRQIGPLTIDEARREVLSDGVAVVLTTREFDLLVWLAAHRGFVLSRQQLLDGVWGRGWYGDERTVDVHIAQLRKKLGSALPLTTVRGIGYRLD